MLLISSADVVIYCLDLSDTIDMRYSKKHASTGVRDGDDDDDEITR